MKTTQLFLIITLFIGLMACETKEKSTPKTTTTVSETTQKETPKTVDKATQIIQETIKAHGGNLYDQANYSFVFRGKKYRFRNDGNSYTYEVESTKDDETTRDILANGKFSRFINTKKIELSEKKITSATGAINSVIYFATLPHKLNDAAVHKKFVEETIIKNQKYDVLEITFSEESGGEDFDDEYYYWINQKTKKIDYLAYNYQVNGGGVRFRSAYNTRVVYGITFQDYINYKAEVGTPLKELPALYEKGKLKELSKIETENVLNLKK
ncbi:hypothetical protein IMCC3317_26240 [Kordia antarctica]|uniref:Deoxyribose-phosphate aldolase n=1 Tax=Kordia antarctica TaxID=1218801 RepID=A0A7L4ZM45_9FLAO|nr:DUF6503 family protein [Kordia antarctica]QHI37246.1 hypothetical protein IMCC3317_26240 [Kordia antarctica]